MKELDKLDPIAMLRTLPTAHYRYQYFPITTDSMEPTLCVGDVLVVDIERDQITQNTIYMVAYDGQPKPRRASLDLKTREVILCCDHAAYRSERVPISQMVGLVVIGEAVACLRRL